MAEYELIEKASDLKALCRHLEKERVVAFDTEADSFYHYFDKTCLIQVADRKKNWLIDPLALGGATELAPLAPIFASPDIRKIFHAAEYDIYILKRDFGFEFMNLFDTMVSAQLLGYPSVGLAALAERHFDVSLPKDEQRSDWSVRPLTGNQLSYAAADVVYLCRLADKLERELRKAKRLDWAYEEFAALTRRAWPAREFDKLGYLKIKGARGLDPESLAALRELFLMRDARARKLDRPPFKVLGNRALLEIAQRRPETEESLGQIKGVTDLILRRMGRDLLAAVAKGAKKSHGPIPKTAGGSRRRMDRRTERRLEILKRWRTERSTALAMDPGVFAPNSALEAVAWKNPDSAEELTELVELKGWFIREFGAEVVEALHRGAAEAKDKPRS
ncbi:MAG: ribonuclease D [Myxococcales bacterium]|nr:ribonuclease D [Myxococcales bacterium]